MLIWRPEGSISTAQVILKFRVSYVVEMLPSGRQMSMTFFITPYPLLLTYFPAKYPPRSEMLAMPSCPACRRRMSRQ